MSIGHSLEKKYQEVKESKRQLPASSGDEKNVALRKSQLSNSMKIINLVSSGDIDEKAQLYSISRGWKVGMSLERPIFRTLNSQGAEYRMKTLMAVKKILWETVDWFKVDKKISEEECMELAIIVMDQYQTMSLEDFILFSQAVKKGSFKSEKTFNRVDAEIILTWLTIWDEKVDIERVRNHAKEKDKTVDVQLDSMKKVYEKFKKEGPKAVRNRDRKQVSTNDYKSARNEYLLNRSKISDSREVSAQKRMEQLIEKNSNKNGEK